MMQYDGDLKLPTNYLVPPPEIEKVGAVQYWQYCTVLSRPAVEEESLCCTLRLMCLRWCTRRLALLCGLQQLGLYPRDVAMICLWHRRKGFV